MGIVCIFITLTGDKMDMYDAVGGVPRAGDLLRVKKTGNHVPVGRYMVSGVEWQDHLLPIVYLQPYGV